MAFTDYPNSANRDDSFSLTAAGYGIGQSFTGNGETIESAKFWVAKLASPVGNAYAKIYTHSGTFGTSSVPTGTALATSDAVAVSGWGAEYAWQTFTFATPFTTVNGTKYFISVEYDGDATNYVAIGLDTSSPTHEGNLAYTAPAWTAYAAGDVIFDLVEGTGTAFYGMCLSFIDLANWNLNAADNRISLRFKAEFTGSITGMHGFWGVANGYGEGTGGTVAASVYADDGTDNHLPTGAAIGTISKAVNYSGGTCDLGTILGGVQVIDTIDFTSPFNVTAGTLYHIVFRNSAAAPTTNWWSLNTFGATYIENPKQPTVSDIDLQLLWSTNAGSSYGDLYDGVACGLPPFTLWYTGGNNQGVPYMERKNQRKVYGSNYKARLGFTVSGSNRTVSSVNIGGYKNGTPGTLTATLQNSALTTLATATIGTTGWQPYPDPDDLDRYANRRWGSGTLNTPVTLTVGQTYYIQFSSSAGDASNFFSLWSVANGSEYGLDGSRFDDSLGSQAMTNGSTWGASDGYDLQAYFDVQEGVETYKNFAGTAALSSTTPNADLVLAGEVNENFSGTASLVSATSTADLFRYLGTSGIAVLASNTPNVVDLALYALFAGLSIVTTTTSSARVMRHANFLGSSQGVSSLIDTDIARFSNLNGTCTIQVDLPSVALLRYANEIGIVNINTDLADVNLEQYANFYGLAQLQSTLNDCILGESQTFQEFSGAIAIDSQILDIDNLRYSNFIGLAVIDSSIPNVSLLIYSNYENTAVLTSDTPDVDLLKFANYLGTLTVTSITQDADLDMPSEYLQIYDQMANLGPLGIKQIIRNKSYGLLPLGSPGVVQ